jgi:flavin reductase (DIM6/NTAB) family NADH-FMN oxidoreductase RutF
MRVVPSPNAGWKPGDAVQSPVGEMVSVDPATLDATNSYKMMIGSIAPRPIAFVSTLNSNGSVNAAPYSSFNLVSSVPPTLVFSVAFKPNGEKKDTLINIERTGEFVVNTVSEWMLEPMNYCSAEFPYGVSELDKVGLTTVPSEIVKPPRVRESAIHFECKLLTTVKVGPGGAGSSTLVVGEVVRFHVDRAAYSDGKIAVEKIKPVSRLGGLRYATVGDIFEVPRP